MKKKILAITLISVFAFAQNAFAEDAFTDTPVKEQIPELSTAKKGFFSGIKAKKRKKTGEQNKTIEAVKIQQPTQETAEPQADVQAAISTTQIMSVDDCIKLSLAHHPSIASATGTAEIYKTKIGQAWSSYFPTFTAGLSYSWNNSFLGTVNSMSVADYQYNLFLVPTISADMLIFDFGKTKSLADYAKANYESSEFSLQDTITQVIFNVKRSYYNLLFALQQEKVYEDTVKDFELHLKQAQAYYNIGTKPKIDVLTAEFNLGNANLNLIKAKNTVQLAYVQVSNAIGMPEFTDYKIKDEFNMKVYDIKLDDALETAFQTRPALLSAKKTADASEILIKATKRAFAPELKAFTSFQNGGRSFNADHGYQFGGELTYTNVNLALLKKQMDEAKATYKRNLANYEVIKQKVDLEVKNAYLDLITAQNSISVAKLSMDRAQEQYNQANGRYKVGLGDAIELKDAENTYRNAQLNYYSTLLNYHVSAATLEMMIGKPVQPSEVDL